MSTQLVGTAEYTSRSHGFVFVGQVTTDGSGDATVAHGMTQVDQAGKTPFVALAMPEDGNAVAGGLVVTADGTNIIIAGGGNAVKYTVLAFG